MCYFYAYNKTMYELTFKTFYAIYKTLKAAIHGF